MMDKKSHDHSVNEHTQMKELKSFGDIGNDSPNSIRRGGGEDPRRYAAQIMIDSAVRDHSYSGYNHNGVISDPESALGNNEHMKMMQRKAMGMGTPHPDGTYSR